MTVPTETELKLECDLDALRALRAHPELAAAQKRRAATLKSVYFDTADRRLRGARVTLRVRTVRARHVQTVKAAGDGLLARPEWERPIAGVEPDRDALAGTPAAEILEPEDALLPVFTALIQRRVFLLRSGASEIEVALDEGRITAGGSEAERAVSEVELELKSGSVADLFTLARTLGEAVPLRLGVRSKSERGYALADGAPSAAAKAGPIALSPEMSTADAFRAIAHHCLRQIGRNEAALLERRDAEAVHQLRVGVRRLRSAVSLFGKVVEDGTVGELVARLKTVSAPFGEARNLDVFLAETLPRERERRPDEGGLLNLEKQLAAGRPQAYEALEAALRSKEWRGLLIDFAAWIDTGPWLSPADAAAEKRLAKPARKFAGKVLDKRRRQVKTRGAGLAALADDERHKVRIAAKKLRYGAQFFAGLYAKEEEPERRKAFVKALKRLQGELGTLNDVATAQAMMADAASTSLEGRSSIFAAGLTAGDLGQGTGQAIANAAEAYDELVGTKPFWR